jgi:L-seryl-tRNA(Ser) seleniumtransferase
MDGPDAAKLRALPPVQALLETPQAASLIAAHGRPAVVSALRTALEAARVALRLHARAPAGADALLAAAAAALAWAPSLVPVINATGIVLHTNLGRAPLAQEAIDAAVAAAGACCLEFDVQTGKRGSRMQGVEPLLRALTGAEAALAVNNGAAAMLLALSALAGGGEVIVSRGELIEIGGGFRIPDVIRHGGARLVEVGTTNKTRLADYRDAITAETRVLLRVHPGNFRMVGFTEAVPRDALAALGRARGLVTVEDLGSGALTAVSAPGRPAEDRVQDAVAAGMDVVVFSGDKLLGGPQAGLLVGREAVIDRMRRHPLMRALRLDKLTLAALEATLRLHRRDEGARIPALRMLRQGEAVLRARAGRLAARLGDYARIAACEGEAGGGTLPAHPFPSVAVTVAVAGCSAEALAARLRAGTPPVIGRISQDRVWLDMLTVAEGEVDALADAVLRACA